MRISHNIPQVQRALENVAKQARFAAAQAMNDAAFVARDAERSRLTRTMTIRRPWVLEGIQVERPLASKANLSVSVAVEEKRDFLAKHETGEDKVPRDGGHIAVPDAQGFDKSIVIPRGRRPKAFQFRTVTTAAGKQQVKGKQRTFILDAGSGQQGIFQRRGKGKSSETRLLYWLATKARIDPTLGFVDTVTTVFGRAFPHRFADRFRDALRSAK